MTIEKDEQLTKLLNFASAMTRIQAAFHGFPQRETMSMIHGHEIDFGDVLNALKELEDARRELRQFKAALSPSGKAGEGASPTSEGGGSV